MSAGAATQVLSSDTEKLQKEFVLAQSLLSKLAVLG